MEDEETVHFDGKRNPWHVALGLSLLLVGGVWLLAMAAAPVLFCLKLLGLI